MRLFFTITLCALSVGALSASASSSDLVRACHAPDESEDVVCGLLKADSGSCLWVTTNTSSGASCERACDAAYAKLGSSLKIGVECRHGLSGLIKIYN